MIEAGATAYLAANEEATDQQIFGAIYAAMDAARPTADLGDDGELVARLRAHAAFVETPCLSAEAADRLILYREALEGLVAAVEKDAGENNGISGYTGARLSDARAVLSRSGG